MGFILNDDISVKDISNISIYMYTIYIWWENTLELKKHNYKLM